MIRLIGSKTEKDIRTQLIKGNSAFAMQEKNREVIEYLLEKYNSETMFLFDQIYDQDFDIYSFVICDNVVIVELDRENKGNFKILNSYSLADYEKNRISGRYCRCV